RRRRESRTPPYPLLPRQPPTREVPMSDTTLVILGATGDLTKRLLMPALYRLHQRGLTPDLRIVGYAMETWTGKRFENHIHRALKSFAADFTETDWETFRDKLDYVSGQLDPDDLK